MTENTKIAFIGGGVMAQAMIDGLINQNLVSSEMVIVSDPILERGQELTKLYNVHYTPNNVEAVAAADVVVLSIKPQTFAYVVADLQGKVPAGAWVLSIVAGLPVQKISQGLDAGAVVRVMPNTPARVGSGMSVWTATEAVTSDQRAQARAILGSLGEEIFVEQEAYLDMATALSGSGPAYIFLLIEALVDAGVHMGFSRQIAEALVLQTVEGSVNFARKYPYHPAELRNMVTSPGGTTADALYQLEKGGFRTIISKAVFAAYQKSKALGGNDQ